MNEADLPFPRRRASTQTRLPHCAGLRFTGASFIQAATSFAECGCARSGSALRDDSIDLVSPKQALAFVKKNGVVLESVRGVVPSLAEAIAGKPVRGNWWAHPKADIIFHCSRAVRASPDVITCRLVAGKITYVHRRLWPALVRLADRFEANRLAAIREIHTAAGKHKIEVTPFPAWVSPEVRRAASNLSTAQATDLLRIRP